ncbi:hypothetical protein TREES_T100012364 [Tupaia chinensis]|uniref:Secreted protein n=1 Tax=Tupaia chinensis TaxID=246437 RepID=L9JCT7_TUPCH|nr:hypothetical protein TREES_T100012364 [Tupaia chinensis]
MLFLILFWRTAAVTAGWLFKFCQQRLLNSQMSAVYWVMTEPDTLLLHRPPSGFKRYGHCSDWIWSSSSRMPSLDAASCQKGSRSCGQEVPPPPFLPGCIFTQRFGPM